MSITRKEWKRKAKMEGRIIGILVLSKEPKIGSNILLPDTENSFKHPIRARVIKIDGEFVYIEKRK